MLQHLSLSPPRPMRVLLFALGAAAFLGSCGPDEFDVVMEKRGPTRVGRLDKTVGPMPSEMRFVDPRKGGHAPHEEPQIDFQTPDTWEQIDRTAMRLLNFRIQGHPEATCFLSVIEGGEEGIRVNADRWRRQLGMEPLTDQEFADLPADLLFNQPAVRVEAAGDFDDGLGGTKIQTAALVGVICHIRGTLLMVKMVGPGEVIAGEREHFNGFVASLAPPGSIQEPEKPLRPIAHDTPQGWQLQGPKRMRLMGFDVGSNVEVSVSVLNFDGGGMALNVNRWRGQLGLPEVSESEALDVERVTVLEASGYWYDMVGAFTGMGDVVLEEDATLLGAIVPLEERTLFVKMIGPSEAVREQEGALQSFLGSLRWEEGQ